MSRDDLRDKRRSSIITYTVNITEQPEYDTTEHKGRGMYSGNEFGRLNTGFWSKVKAFFGVK